MMVKGPLPAAERKIISLGLLEPCKAASDVLRRMFAEIDALPCTQKQFAERIGVNENTMTRYRRGQTTPSIVTLEAMAQVIGFRIELVRDE